MLNLFLRIHAKHLHTWFIRCIDQICPATVRRLKCVTMWCAMVVFVTVGELVFAIWKDVWCRAVVCELFQKGCIDSVSQCFASNVACMQVFFQDCGSSKGFTISGWAFWSFFLASACLYFSNHTKLQTFTLG